MRSNAHAQQPEGEQREPPVCCSVQFDSARSRGSCALEYLSEEVTIAGEGRLQRRNLLDGHPAGITNLPPVRPEIVVLRVRQPPVQCMGPSR
jgi:hypothetical protein